MTKRTLTLSGGPDAYTLHIDGQDVSKGVRRVTIDVGHLDGPRVEAELIVHAVEVTTLSVENSQFVLSMPDEARTALIALGWTPPAGDQ